MAAQPCVQIADYDVIMDPRRAARLAKSGNQPGDPVKAAEVLLALVAAPDAQVRFFLIEDAVGLVTQKLDAMAIELAAWERTSRSTGFAAWFRVAFCNESRGGRGMAEDHPARELMTSLSR